MFTPNKPILIQLKIYVTSRAPEFWPQGYNDDRTRREGYNRRMLTGIIISITPLNFNPKNSMFSVTDNRPSDNQPSDTLGKVKTQNQKSWFCSEHVTVERITTLKGHESWYCLFIGNVTSSSKIVTYRFQDSMAYNVAWCFCCTCAHPL